MASGKRGEEGEGKLSLRIYTPDFSVKKEKKTLKVYYYQVGTGSIEGMASLIFKRDY